MFGLKKNPGLILLARKRKADPWDPWTRGRGGESEYSINIKSTIISVLGIRKERSEQQGAFKVQVAAVGRSLLSS